MTESAAQSSASMKELMHELESGLTLRIAGLEAESARLRRMSLWTVLGMAILLGLVIALVAYAARRGMPGSVAKTIEARSFVVRDASGRVRGAWGMAEDGSLRFSLQDVRGKGGVTMTVLKDGSAGVTIADTLGNDRAVIGLLPDQTTTLVFADGAGRSRTVLGLSPDGASSLAFADRNGSTRIGLGLDARANGTFSMPQRPEATVPATEPDSGIQQ